MNAIIKSDRLKLVNLSESSLFLKMDDTSIIRMLASPRIKAVSFGLLDCLLVAPFVFMEDFFHLVGGALEERGIKGFARIRGEMEIDLAAANIDLTDVYEDPWRAWDFAPEILKIIQEEELNAWRRLTIANRGILPLYGEAVKQGKKIFLIEDTFLPQEFVVALLAEKGFGEISAVYLSHEFRANKASGELYQKVYESSSLQPGELLHVGADLKKDYYMAQKEKVCAIWRPEQPDWLDVEAVRAIPDSDARLVMGFMRCYCRDKGFTGAASAFEKFVLKSLAPFAIALSSKLANKGYEPDGLIFPPTSSYGLQEAFAAIHSAIKASPEPPKEKSKVFLYLGAEHAAEAGADVVSVFPDMIDYTCGKNCGARKDFHKKLPDLLAAFFGGDQLASGRQATLEAKKKYEIIARLTGDAAATFAAMFGDYARSLRNRRLSIYLRELENLFLPGPPDKWEVLDYLPTAHGKSAFLKEEVLNTISFPDGESGTGFDGYDPPGFAAVNRLPEMRIGLHIHLWDMFLYQEFSHFLYEFPAKFDLYITIGSENDIPFVESLFSQIPLLGKLRIIEFPNRGRDMSAWLIGMNGIQDEYDLFGNVHSKYSPQTPMSAQWRDHLLSNLLGRESVLQMLQALANDAAIGCIFPGPSPWWQKTIRSAGWNMLRPYMQNELIPGILSRLGIKHPFLRTDMIFSLGSMYWYRPKAFHQFFESGICLEDFHPEPVPPDNTFVHAVERLFPFVCACNGYKSLMV